MKVSVLFGLFSLLGMAVAQTDCENQADPDHGIGNYCYCGSTGACYSHSIVNGQETCNPPGFEIPCPD